MRPFRRAVPLASVLAATALLLVGPAFPRADAAPGDPVDPASESANFQKQSERAPEYLSPDGVQALTTQGVTSFLDALTDQAGDPERFYLSDACWSGSLTCSGDPRLARWQEDGHGRVREVLFTARNGATLSGHVWATKAGPASRPLVVITNGSVQAPEQLYWDAAQVLAKAGYVVVTWDAQGQGRSDTLGEGDDLFDSVPSQSTGVTFYDGTQDALDFALSSEADPYCPRKSRSGTSHCATQERRVAAGKNAASNPFARLVDPRRVGIAGHSYGASGVTWVGNQDRRVDAVVAWDNLCDLATSSSAGSSSNGSVPRGCMAGGQGTSRPRVPSLGLSADYGLVPTPYLQQPDPLSKSAGSLTFSKAGVDTGELVVRGGTHYEFSFIPTPAFGATLRGIDLTAWYTTAWFDRYVKGDRSATDRLLTTRWRADAREAAADPGGDGNLFSTYFRSRLDLGHDGGRRVACENLRKGCSALAPDGSSADYAYLAIATSPDR